MTKISVAVLRLAISLPCFGFVTFGATNLLADPPERTGADAPHQERNLPKNEQRSALPLSEVAVPAFSGTQKPVRKATAVKTASNSRAAKDKKKAEQQAKQKAKADAAAEEAAQERHHYDAQVDDSIGSDAPHQERGSDPGKRAARLFILDR